jgi:hypothetical protein
MPETYKVTQYIGADADYDYTPPNGDEMKLRPHQVLMEGPDAPNATVTINRLADGDAPTVGEELVGDIIKGKQGYRFQKDRSGYTQSSNGSDGGSKYDRRPDHPQTQARYRHTSALSAAPDYMKLAMESPGVAPTPKTWDEFWTLAEQTIAKLEATYQGEARG